VAAGLFFMGVFGTGLFSNGLPVRHPGNIGLNFDLLACFNLVQNNIDLKFPHTGDNGFLGFHVKLIAESFIFLRCPNQGFAEFIVVFFRHCVNRYGVNRLGKA